MSRRSRRELLRTAGVALTAGVAGCLSNGSQSTPTGGADVIRDTSFDGTFLVVKLAPEHEVSQLNLIGPEGSLLSQTSVATGETRAKLELLNIQPEPSYKHYTPGEHELIAIQADTEVSDPLDLRPKFELTTVEQNRDPEYESQLGNLAFTFENSGSGPSWVYDIVFSGAPYSAANNELSDSPGVPYMAQPEEKEEFIVEPGAKQVFVSSNPPFIFEDDGGENCTGEYELTAVVGFPTEDSREIQISAEMGGDTAEVGLADKHTCTEIDVAVLDDGTSNA